MPGERRCCVAACATATTLPLPGVTITVLGHPEFGQTLSRADGRFDLAVNGGGVLTLNYAKSGHLPVQRQIHAPWQDYAVLPDIVMIVPDSQVTAIDLTSPAPIQVAHGNPVTDTDGTRRATLMFPAGTEATLVMPDGSTQPLTTLNVRATEYTVGPNGPARMPAALPPTSGYTYAVELSVDEALAAGASEVRFSSPVSFYVENFLDFPVGIAVPLGSYDRSRGVWIPADSGRVIKVLSVSGGIAVLDVDGDGVADSEGTLAAMSITDAERQRLADLYPPGQTLWRMRIPHFSPWDGNWPVGPPADAVFPVEDPQPDVPLDVACEQPGSIIDCQNQTLGEVVGVAGTPFGLHYQSERVPGRKVAYSLEIPLSGGQLPASLRHIDLEIQVAGRLFQQTFPPTPNQRTTFTWDGRDSYGRTLQGTQPVTVRIGYTYGFVYWAAPRFGSPGVNSISSSRSRGDFTFWRTWGDRIGNWDSRAAGLGGWTLSTHHAYDPAGQVLYRGDGRKQTTRALAPFISTFAGTITFACLDGEGGPAALAGVCPSALAVAPDRSVYIAYSLFRVVRRVDANGIINRVAGTGATCAPTTAPCGDNGPAIQAQITAPWSVAVGPDNSYYIADLGAHRVRKVRPDGIITTIAGTGVAGFSGDAGPANQAQISSPASVAVGADNGVYISEQGSRRIRHVAPDGIITTFAGTGQQCLPATAPCGDGGPALQARLSGGASIAIGRDGSLYIGDGARLRRIGPDGIISTVAGDGNTCGNLTAPCGDGGPATQARFGGISALAIGDDDTVYFAHDTFRVRWFRPNGTINTLAGPFRGTSGDGGLAPQARLDGVKALAVGPDGSLYVAESAGSNHQRVRRIAPIAAGDWTGGFIVPGADGNEVYVFDPSGRHLRTVDALTAVQRQGFTYDGAGRLTAITDVDGNVTTIERNASGGPTAIVGPFGQRTALTAGADGYLDGITSPAGEVVQLAYASDGLLTDFTNPRGHVSHYVHDALGRLTSATDPTGATKTLARAGTNRAHTITLTSPLGRVSTYDVEHLGTGDVKLTNTDAAGIQFQAVIGKNGTQSATHPDGTTVSQVLGPDPRWGMQAPLAASVTVTTPGGKVHTTTTQRTATLTTPTNLLSLATMNETVTINGRAFTSAYSAASRTLTSTSPNGRQTTLIVDTHGRPAQAQLGGFVATSYTYDAKGRVAAITEGSGAGSRTTALAYGADGFVQSVTDASGRLLGFARDADGRITEQTFPDGALVRVAYDANSNVLTFTPPGRPDHAFTYNQHNQVSADIAPVVGAQNSQTLNTYDADRQPVQVDGPDSPPVILQYDAAGRPSVVNIASGGIQYGYDAAGRLATVDRDQGVNLAYAYDGGLPTGVAWSGAIAGSVSGVYDNNFRVTSLAVNGTNPIALAYDLDGLPVQVGALTLTRNAQNELITGTALGTITDATTYDVFGAPASYVATRAGNAVYSTTYIRDALGRIVSKSETIGGVTHVFAYAYDPAGRLTEVRLDGALSSSYGYDINGNRLSRTDADGTTSAAYDAQDRLEQFGTTTFTHNASGERSSTTTGGQTTTYGYDSLGQLNGVTLPGATRIDYVLDGGQRRVGKKVDGVLVQGFLYQDGLKPIVELDGSNNVVSRFVYSDDINVPAYMIKAGVPYRIITDHLGSARLVIDASTGSIAQRLDYDEFGKVTLDTSPGFQPFGFAGGLYDAQTGLVHFGAREYDAETGRWTAKDPVGFDGGDTNLYNYAATDPINYSDELGMEANLNLFGTKGKKDPLLRKHAQKLKTDKNAFVVAGHGAEGLAFINRRQVSAAELWERIRKAGYRPGSKIVLLLCHSADKPEGKNKLSLAAEISRLSGGEVEGVHGYVTWGGKSLGDYGVDSLGLYKGGQSVAGHAEGL